MARQSEKLPGAHRSDCSLTSMFPCLQLIAYCTPPPAWPRRLFCENKFFACGCSRTSWLITAAILLLYFFIMDIILFTRFQRVNLVFDSRVGALDEIYTPITHLSVKAILNDHPSQFIIAPSTEYFDMLTHFSSLFSFITPNMISFAHLICGLIAGKFIASDNLQDRRIGVILFEYRTWLDAFDGTVHRAQRGLHLQYHSDHSTMGYAIDAGFDTLGGFFLCFAIGYYLRKRFGSEKEMMPWCFRHCDAELGEAATLTNGHGTPGTEPWSLKYIIWSMLSVGLCLAISGKCWDQAVEDFTNVFQVELHNDKLSALQLELSHSYTTVTLFYLWRVFGGQSVLNYILLTIYMDKVPEFLKYTHYILISIALALYLVTALYIQQIRSILQL